MDKVHNIITDAKFGFKPGVSTIDAIFVLHSLVRRTLKRKKKFYCCFIDYQKAFDFIDRSSLWSKLIKQGITGNIFSVIRSLYSLIKVCVKHNGQLTDYFNSTSGLLQGEVMSPILFSLYVNDLSSNCWDQIPRTCHVFTRLFTSNTPWYFLDFTLKCIFTRKLPICWYTTH